MKNLLNKKLMIPALLLVLVFVIVILYRLGFRITYAPELENSWEAVSASAEWVGVISSFVAIWFAIQVPKKIAEEQNKIALFEKRHKLYRQFAEMYNFSISVGDACDIEMIQNLFYQYYGPWDNNLDNSEEIHKRIIKLIFEFSEAKFLFDEEIGSSVIRVVHKMSNIIYAATDKEQGAQIDIIQKSLIEELESENCMNILGKMEYYLKFNK